MSLSPLKKSFTLSEQAYEEIRNGILCGKLRPGDIMTEEKLSEELSISRTPIRTALQRLLFEGLLSSCSNKKLIVTPISKEDIKQINPIRCALETLAIRLIVPGTVPQSSIKALEETAHKQSLCISFSHHGYNDYLLLDHKFHMAIVDLAQNAYLYDMAEKTSLLFNRFLLLSGTLEKHSLQALDEHREILQFLKDEKYEFAQISMEKHILSAGERIFQ